MLASGDVIKEDDLGVLFGFDLDALRPIAGRVVRVHVDDFAIALVPEKEPGVRVGVHAEVWRIVERAVLRLPVVVRKIRRLREESLLGLEVEAEILGLEAVSEVYVTAYLILAVLVVADEDYRRHSSVAHELLSLSQGLQEGALLNLASGVRKGLRLVRLFVLLSLRYRCLTLAELVSRQDFALAVVAHLDELASKLLVLKVKEVLGRHVEVEVLLIVCEFFKGGVHHVTLELVVLHLYCYSKYKLNYKPCF